MKKKQAINSRCREFFTLLVAAAFFLIGGWSASAAVITVNTIADENGAGADCSLREAVQAANTDAAFGGCAAGAGADTIQFDAGVFGSAQTIDLGAGELAIITDITITGTGAKLLTVRNALAGNRVFRVDGPNGALTLQNATVTGGSSSGDGGGIFSSGTLNLTNAHITGNTTGGFGGGIAISGGSVNISGSTISNNTSNGGAGGSSAGGGIDNFQGTLTIANSTISGNIRTDGSGASNGGGIFSTSAPSVTIMNSTITDNQVVPGSGAGGVAEGGLATITVRNTIIAANRNNGGDPDVAGAFTSNGYNLIGNAGTATGFTGTADQSGVSNANANLGALADNGGQTPTHALLSGSFAIDKGDSSGAATDQRGQTRPFDNPSIANATGGDGADIGAFEVQTVTSAGVSVTGRVLTPRGTGLFRAQVRLTDQQGNTRVVSTNPFGYYRFTGIEAGQTYVVTVFSKKISFDPAAVTISEDLTELNFVGRK